MGTSVLCRLTSWAGVAQANHRAHLRPSRCSGETEAWEGKGLAKGGGNPHVRNPPSHDLIPRCTEDHNEVWWGVRCHLESIFKSGRLTPHPFPLP